jgi:hypothetical protein
VWGSSDLRCVYCNRKLCSWDTCHCFRHEYAYHYGLVCLVAIGLPAGCGVGDLRVARCSGRLRRARQVSSLASTKQRMILLIVGKSSIRIIVRTPTVVTEASRDLSQSLQANTRIVTWNRPLPVPSTSLLVHNSLIFPLFGSPGFGSRQGQNFSYLDCVQTNSEVLSSGYEGHFHRDWSSPLTPHLVPSSGMVELYLHFPIRLHAVVLK